MPGFTIYEASGSSLSEATITVDVGAFGEVEASHSIAILYDTVRLQFGETYGSGAGTQAFKESAVADAWVEYSYTYDPDAQFLELKEAYGTAVELQEIHLETPGEGTWEEYWAARNAYISLFGQAVVDGLEPQAYLDLDDYIAKHGQPDGFESGTYNRSLFRGAPYTSEFAGLDIEMYTSSYPSSFSPGLPDDPLFPNNVFHLNPYLWTVSDTATVHITFEESQLEEFLGNGHVLEGGKVPSNSVLVVVEHDADWSLLSSHEVGDYSPENLEGTIRVLDTFPDYVPPIDFETATYVDEVIINIPALEDMGINFSADAEGDAISFGTSEYTFSNDAAGQAPSASDSWVITNPDATSHTEGGNRVSFYYGVSEALTSGIFELFKTQVENFGLRELSNYFTGSEDAAELAVSINSNLSDPLMRAIDSLDDENPEEMILRFDNIMDGIVETVSDQFPQLGSILNQLVVSGRHSSYSYQAAFDPNNIPQGDAHSNRVVFGATGATYHAGADADYLFGGIGADFLYGEDGEDFLSGGDNDDLLEGGAGSNWMFGGKGHDTLISNAAQDLAEGGAGDDLIRLGGGENYSNGFVAFNVSSDSQVGTDVRVNLEGLIRIEAVIDGGADADTVQLSEAGDAFFLHDAYSGFHSSIALTEDYVDNESAARFTNIEEIRAMGGDDIIDLTSPDYSLAGAYLYVDGGDGNDIIWGSDADEFIYGGNGDDTIFGGNGLDILAGGFGADVFEFTRTSTDASVIDFDLVDGDMLRFYNTGGAEFDASSAALINGGMIISYTDIAAGTSHDLSIALEGPLGQFSATLPELMNALEII